MLGQYGDFLTTKQASDVLHRSEWGVRDLCRRGILPSVKVGQRILIPTGQLVEYINANMKGGAA